MKKHGMRNVTFKETDIFMRVNVSYSLELFLRMHKYFLLVWIVFEVAEISLGWSDQDSQLQQWLPIFVIGVSVDFVRTYALSLSNLRMHGWRIFSLSILTVLLGIGCIVGLSFQYPSNPSLSYSGIHSTFFTLCAILLACESVASAFAIRSIILSLYQLVSTFTSEYSSGYELFQKE